MNQDRELLVALCKGLEDHLVTVAMQSVQTIVRHANQEELPTAAAEDVANDILDATEYKGQMTIWGMFVKYYKPQRLAGKSPETSRLYRISVRHFSRWLGRPALLSDLTDERVGAFSEHRVEVCKSRNTAQKDVTQILCMWRYATLRQLGPPAPIVREPDGSKPVPDAWTEQELDQLIRHIRTLSAPMPNGTPARLFWEALLSLVLDTGERITACLNIKSHQLDGDGWLFIPPDDRKGRKEGKRFKLSQNTREVLEKLRPYQSGDSVLEWPYCRTYIWAKYGRVLDGAGLPNKRRTKFHKMRRTCATYYEAAGGDATKLLGHSNRIVTDAYIDQRFVTTPQPADINPKFFGKPN